MSEFTSYKIYIGLFQIGLCLAIAGTCYGLYNRSPYESARYRLKIFGAAFILYAVKISLRLYVPEDSPLYPSLTLFLQHSLGVIFFILLGAVGLLYFVEPSKKKQVKKVSYFLILTLILFDLIYVAYTIVDPTALRHTLALSKAMHVYQIMVLVFVTAVILRKITRQSHPGILLLPKKYPFGFGVVLLMLADVGHILNLTIFQGMVELSLLEYILTTISLMIITWKVYDLSKEPKPSEAEVRSPRDEVSTIDNVLRQVYYGLSYIDVGERDIVFNDFLEKTGLKKVFDRKNVGIDPEKLRATLEENPDFLFEVAEGMLEYFKENPQSISELQTFYLTEYLSMLYSLTEKKSRSCPVCGKPSCTLYSSFRLKKKEGHVRYGKLWRMLSEAYKKESPRYFRHFDKLRDWGSLATNAFFESEHYIGSKSVDDRVKIPAKGFALSIRNAEIDKKIIFQPMIMKNLVEGRNVIYVSSEPLEKIQADFNILKDAVYDDRLIIVSLSSKTAGLEEVSKNCYRIRDSTTSLLNHLENFIQSFPLSSVIVAIDLNPLVIKETPKDIHNFITELMEAAFLRNLTIFASISGNMNPVSMDILEDGADVILRHSLLDGEVITTVLKPSLGERTVLKKELYELLQYVNEENSKGREPNFNDVKEKLKITSVTTRRRINELVRRNMLMVKKRGRSKTLRMTSKGRETLLAGRS